MTRHRPPGVSELIAGAAVVLAAALLRFWSPASMGIEHFDEGVYVISALGLTDPALPDPLFAHQLFFSPPLYFGIVYVAQVLTGGALDLVAVLVSASLGTLTVALVWWAGRSWFGPGAGLAAAGLLALSEFHIALSRTALTDVTFAFFLLLAVVLIERALRGASLAIATAAGLTVGLAWNTKYHGWLALALGLSAWIGYSWHRGAAPDLRRSLVVWAVIAGVAVAAWLPWTLYIQSQPGGYASLTQWQGVFMEGAWLDNLVRHLRQERYLDGPLTDASVPVAIALALLGAGVRRLSWRAAGLGVCLTAASCLAGGYAAVVLLGLAGLVSLMRGPGTLAGWLAGICLTTFMILTPFYHPYARLFLPITAMASLLAGLSLGRLATWESASGRGLRGGAALFLAVSATVVALGARPANGSDPWRAARGAADAAAAMAKAIPLGSRVKVIEEPSVAYYLHRDGFDTLRNVHDKEMPRDETGTFYVVTGYYGTAGLEQLGDRVSLVGSFPMKPKDIRLTDDLVPPFVSRDPAADSGEHDLYLFKVKALGAL